MRRDTAFEKCAELVFDEPGKFRSDAGLGTGDEAGRVLMHQAVQGGLLGSVTLAVERRAIGRPLGPPANDVHDGLPVRRARTVASRAACINRSGRHLLMCGSRRGTTFGYVAWV